jgi:hypothetical protein
MNSTMKQHLQQQLRQKIEIKKITDKLDQISECKNNLDINAYSWIPVAYRIVLTPTFPEFDFSMSNDIDLNSVDTSAQTIEMKTDMVIKIYCNKSSNSLKLRTREFSSIRLQ